MGWVGVVGIINSRRKERGSVGGGRVGNREVADVSSVAMIMKIMAGPTTLLLFTLIFFLGGVGVGGGKYLSQ